MRGLVSRLNGCLAAILLLAFLRPAAAEAQGTARVKVAEENFRREPRGTQLATVLRGSELALLGEQGDWVEVELEGWIWAPSVAQTDRDGFDLMVRVDGSENLREQPQGTIIARVLEGCLLQRIEASGNWVRVRRRGFLWKASLDMVGEAAVESAPGAAEAAVSEGAAEDAGESVKPPPVLTASTALVVFATPDGDTVAQFQPGAQAQVLGRTGDWIRVRVDGWVYGPTAFDSVVDVTDTGSLTPAQLRADPGRHKGALIRWRVQFISLRRAERARTDFDEGEPFLLARGPAGDPGFVYLAVPEELLAVVESLEPLQYVTVVGRVRTGRSSLLGSPVVDLTDVEVERMQD
ncbi:MAG: hypothetical protein JSU87_04790 [Gemmatimonadota bacterium]|nr:MAG: hypothetical protein JSU87_04790 [Gemmatimonadota bacterium]